jgi:hypothetical protein
MGGYGSGRTTGRPTVEGALRIDIDAMMRRGAIRPGAHIGGEMRFEFYDQELTIQFESRVGHPENSWIRLKYTITDNWTGDEHEIDDQIFLVRTQPRFGGERWWFECPRSRRRVRVLHLPLGGRHFWSRRAYRLAYASQRETAYDRASRRSANLCRRLGGHQADDTYPDKPKHMRWKTYNRIMEKIVAAGDVADERLVMLAARWLRDDK